MILKNSVKNGWLKSRNLSEEKKTHPEHKYSVTFVSKVGTISISDLLNNLPPPPPLSRKGGGDSLVGTIGGGVVK